MRRYPVAILLPLLIAFSSGLDAKKKAVKPAEPPPARTPEMTGAQKALHALNRLTFGARPDDLEALNQKGLDQWIEQQLHPQTIPENPALEAKLASFVTLQATT